MFNHYPQGVAKKMLQTFLDFFNATTVCDLKLNKSGGQLQRTLRNQIEYEAIRRRGENALKCGNMNVRNIHGYMHITDLDFYRQPKVINGLKALRVNRFLCRNPDDQLAVTLLAAIYALEKSWDMRLTGFDGLSETVRTTRIPKYWAQIAAKVLPTTDKVCKITVWDR